MQKFKLFLVIILICSSCKNINQKKFLKKGKSIVTSESLFKKILKGLCINSLLYKKVNSQYCNYSLDFNFSRNFIETKGITTFSEFYLVADGAEVKKFIGEGILNNSQFLGNLAETIGITSDNVGNSYVTVPNECQFFKLDINLNILNMYGSCGDEKEEFRNIFDIAYNFQNNQVYITDSDNNNVQIFTNNGVFIQIFGNTGVRKLISPTGIAIDDDDNIYVVNGTGTSANIAKYDSNGNFNSEFAKVIAVGSFFGMNGISFNPRFDNILYLNQNLSQLFQYNKNGILLNKLNLRFNYAQDLAVDLNGNLYITYFDNSEFNVIEKYICNTLSPSEFPTLNPVFNPTGNPTLPTISPTFPTMIPTIPTLTPTLITGNPTLITFSPTLNPTLITMNPTIFKENPTANPTEKSIHPTLIPTVNPTLVTINPTENPTNIDDSEESDLGYLGYVIPLGIIVLSLCVICLLVCCIYNIKISMRNKYFKKFIEVSEDEL